MRGCSGHDTPQDQYIIKLLRIRRSLCSFVCRPAPRRTMKATKYNLGFRPPKARLLALQILLSRLLCLCASDFKFKPVRSPDLHESHVARSEYAGVDRRKMLSPPHSSAISSRSRSTVGWLRHVERAKHFRCSFHPCMSTLMPIWIGV